MSESVDTRAEALIEQFKLSPPTMGKLKKVAKEIKKDHELAMVLWATASYYPCLLATLILDKMQLSQTVIDQMADDIAKFETAERNHISEWLLANQLMKAKKTSALVLNWESHPSPVLRRLFWYHQARLRWMGNGTTDNSLNLLNSLEQHMSTEAPEVQWSMNFCAGQIGIHEPMHRAQCIALGERIGLYKGDKVAKNCTPAYLPEFIAVEVAKLKQK